VVPPTVTAPNSTATSVTRMDDARRPDLLTDGHRTTNVGPLNGREFDAISWPGTMVE
jgi:hypothetical protein